MRRFQQMAITAGLCTFLALTANTAEIKLRNSGDACNNDNLGAMYFNDGDDTFYFCRTASTGWEAFEDLAPASSGGGNGGILKVYDGEDNAIGYLLDILGENRYIVADITSREVIFANTENPGTGLHYVYFTGSNCSGSPYINVQYGRCGFACPGSANCKSGFRCTQQNVAYETGRTYYSRRDPSGDCVNTSGSMYKVVPAVTENAATRCKIAQDCTVGP